MASKRFVVICFVTLMFVACSYGPPTIGENKDFDSVCAKDNNGKRVAIEGYLRFPEKFTGDQSVVLRLYKGGDYSGTPVGVQTSVGSQANQMELPPSRYTDNDLKVHLTDGQVAGVGTKVKVSGNVYFPMVAQDFTCSLENPLIESAK